MAVCLPCLNTSKHPQQHTYWSGSPRGSCALLLLLLPRAVFFTGSCMSKTDFVTGLTGSSSSSSSTKASEDAMVQMQCLPSKIYGKLRAECMPNAMLCVF